MMKHIEERQIKMHFITIEDLVPQNHLLRKIDQLVYFSFIYEELEDSYCKNNGRPSIDPVILIKYLLIGFLYGIDSERRQERATPEMLGKIKPEKTHKRRKKHNRYNAEKVKRIKKLDFINEKENQKEYIIFPIRPLIPKMELLLML